MHVSHRIGAGLLASTVLLGGAGSALAAKGTGVRSHTGFVIGQVSNVTPTGFTITRSKPATPTSAATTKAFTVTLGATVKERAAKGTTGALTNGEYALVIGQMNATGVTAKRVMYSTNPTFIRRAARALARTIVGTVTASTPTSVSITTKRGVAHTFALTATTKYRANKVVSTTAPVFTVGEKVRVVFKRDKATKSLVALAIGVPTAK